MAVSDQSEANYRILDRESLPEYLSGIPSAMNILGTDKNLDILEIGDGNLNFVYRVSNADDPARSVIVKQAVPYLRLAGEAWPLGKERMLYEIRALKQYKELTPGLIPTIFHADEAMSTLVMQYLGDHIILRHGMIEGIQYPLVARHVGEFLGETLFSTSAWSMDGASRRELMDQFTMNTELCKLTEDFIFTFPFIVHESNYSNPSTDQWVKENIHTDYQYKRDVLIYKDLFVTKTEALLHGDIHTGSLMVNQYETYVIDPEFAFFGPISFDVGKFISNILLCYTAHYHRKGGVEYQQWLFDQIPVVWNTFSERFLTLWGQSGESSTMMTKGYFDAEEFARMRSDYMVQLLLDAAGFAACSMARRTIGIAGVADIRDIEDVDIRSTLEIANLKLSKRLMAERKSLNTIDDFLAIVKDFHSTPLL